MIVTMKDSRESRLKEGSPYKFAIIGSPVTMKDSRESRLKEMMKYPLRLREFRYNEGF